MSITGLNLFLHTDNKCYQTCPQGYFGNVSAHKCDACDGSCDGCSLSATNCILCATNNYRQIGSNECGACATGYYGDNSTNLCTVCPVGCAECSAASVCSKCKAVAGVNYYLNSSACLVTCPSGSFGTTDGSGNLVCSSCTGPCATCKDSGTTCLSCTSGNVLYYTEATCSNSCPNGEYDGGSQKCKPCSIYCQTCTNSASNCQSCKSLGGIGYYLNGTSCIATCPDGTFKNTSTLKCDSCPSACATCFGSALTKCYSCKNDGTNNYYLLYGTYTCNQTCSAGQYAVNSSMQCLLCASTCTTC